MDRTARTALWGFLLNMIWEFVQCPFLYSMGSWGFWRATAWMWGAIVGDMFIVLGVVTLSHLAVGSPSWEELNGRSWIALLVVGFVAAVFLEWASQVLGLWGYTSLMPTLHVAGHTVGLGPVVQITLLPAASAYLGTRH